MIIKRSKPNEHPKMSLTTLRTDLACSANIQGVFDEHRYHVPAGAAPKTFLILKGFKASMTLTATRSLPVPLATLMGYENPKLVSRYCTDTGASSEQAHRAFAGMKQFLAVCAMTPGWKVTSDPIDSMWHTFLLFTRDYARFCEKYLGLFLHHEPFEEPHPELYDETKAVARVVFGDLDDEMWPVKAKGDCSSGCGS